MKNNYVHVVEYISCEDCKWEGLSTEIKHIIKDKKNGYILVSTICPNCGSDRIVYNDDEIIPIDIDDFYIWDGLGDIY